jgi:hypothetical protein
MLLIFSSDSKSSHVPPSVSINDNVIAIIDVIAGFGDGL